MKIYIIGGGCGNFNMITKEAQSAIDRCEVIVGPERITAPYAKEKKTFTEYKAEKIKCLIDDEKKDTAVLMGGDTGFYSGAKKLLELLDGYETEVIPGISSVSYFASKIGVPWHGWKFISLHGTSCNFIGHIRENKYTFAILSSGSDISTICAKLILYNMNDIELYIGENLSYSDEKIEKGTAEYMLEKDFKNLSVILAVNEKAEKKYEEVQDKEFIRDRVPMTKSEIRTVSLSKLGLKSDSVLYDIGAGTGSVAISAALLNPDLKVFAVEKNEKALNLINLNKIKFAVDNVEIVNGEAPEILEGLPEPTHVFIGGSGGKLKEIISCMLIKKRGVKFVINTVTVETLCEIKNILDKHSIEAEIVQLIPSKGEKNGKYTLMKSANPVYIISFSGR